MTKYLSCVETAKMLRTALKQAFPDVRFTVKSSVYSMGASIVVGWVDGPCAELVDGLAGLFGGSSFDGMDDRRLTKTHLFKGETVRLGADSVRTSRHNSDAAIAKAIARVMRKYAEEFAAAGTVAPSVDAFKRGELISMSLPGMSDDMQQEISRALWRNSDRLAVKKSAMAANMLHIATDGRPVELLAA